MLSARHNPNLHQIAISPLPSPCRGSDPGIPKPHHVGFILLELSLRLSTLTCNHPAGFTLLFYHLCKPFYQQFWTKRLVTVS